MSRKNIKVVQSFFEAAPRGDLATARAVLDPQIEWIEPGVPGLWFTGTHHGPDAVFKEVIEPTFDHIENFSLQIDQYLDAGDRVVALGHFRGRGKTTGREFNIPVVFICTVHGGKIVWFQTYHDTARWLQVLGQPTG